MKCNVQNWLTHPYSITDRLVEKAGDAVLMLLNQGWHSASVWDKQKLNDPSPVWCREIIMIAQGEACWYARTIIPEVTYKSNLDFFDQLKTKSLGDLIFDSPIVQRTSLTQYPIDENTSEYQWIPDSVKPASSKPLWARLSHLILHQQFSFYLVEILLPAAERYND